MDTLFEPCRCITLKVLYLDVVYEVKTVNQRCNNVVLKRIVSNICNS